MRVLLAGGGSGGSATPLLAVADELRERERHVEFLYVGTRDGPEVQLVAEEGITYVGVSAGKLRRYWSTRNVTDMWRVASGFAESLRHVRRFRPDVGFGAGGFASAAPLAAARWTGVPILIHQQDVVPGLANRLLVPLASRISVSMPQTLGHFPAARTRLRGNPVRSRVLRGDAREVDELGFNPDLPLVLVTGGGTGALALNRLVAEAAPELVDMAQVLHLTGRGRGVPSDASVPRYVQREFLVEQMPSALRAATVAVTRAGMGTLSELAALSKPTVIVPMPGSHQEANAAAFRDGGAAIVCHEHALTPPRLVAVVRDLLTRDDRRHALAAAISEIMPRDAASRLADEVATLARGQPRPT